MSSATACRHALAARILCGGSEASIRCLSCQPHPCYRCWVSSDSKCCYKCVRRGNRCQFPEEMPSSAEFRQVDQARDRIRSQLEKAQQSIEQDETEIQSLTQQIQCLTQQAQLLTQQAQLLTHRAASSQAKVIRLLRLLSFLNNHSRDLFERELAEIEALEEAEQQQENQSSRGEPCCEGSLINDQAVASNSAVSAGSPGTSRVNLPVDFFRLPSWDSSLADLFSSGVVDPLVLDNLGSGGGIP
ncbi:hypothetical protein M432DRAFT_399826 [Thermoascus aurantiacus ATCC 26904]